MKLGRGRCDFDSGRDDNRQVERQGAADYGQLRGFDSVHRIEGTDAFLVARVDLIREVVANPHIYSSQSSEFLCVGEANQPGLRSPAAVPVGLEGMEAVLATADPQTMAVSARS